MGPRAVYSPQLRTGVLLTGSGTAGAYHAGALRALIEAGIKIDVIAAHGSGMLTALAVAVDGGSRVWDSSGPWTDPRLREAYRWRPALRFAFAGFLATIAVLLFPLVILAMAAVVYALATVAALVSLTGTAEWLVATYQQMVEMLFDPPILPTILPRALVFAVLVIAGVVVAAAAWAMWREQSRRRISGAFWWRLISSPLDATEPAATSLDTIWRLVRGASPELRAPSAEVGRRYVDVLADNFGQPGFHEVLVGVHDLDARQDLVGAILAASSRAAFESPREEEEASDGAFIDLTGPQRETLAGFLVGAFRLPIVNEPATVSFPLDSYWRAERHRVCDRPELAVRLVQEITRLGVEQLVIVSPAAEPARPSMMRARPIDLRGRTGELVRSIETAAVVDAATLARTRCQSVFVVRPDHNPIGPFDFGGVYDEASDRRLTLAELIEQGRVDAYRLVVEPAVATEEELTLTVEGTD